MQAAETPERVHREVEHKFRVHGLYRLPDLDAVAARVDDLGTVELASTYLDTADVRLAREGISLRRRTGGHDAGWHLKLPAAPTPGVRDEIQLPLAAGAVDRPPQELTWLVRALVRDDPLVPIASLRTERTTWVLRDPSGEPIAELVDDTVHVVGADGHVSARFRELELEEGPAATTAAIERIGAVLHDSGAVGGEFVAKVVRALGQGAAAPPEVPEPTVPSPDAPAREAIAAYLARYTRALRTADVAVRRDSEDAVHKLRVATRRLRSGLRTFRPLLSADWADGLRDELRWAAGSLGRFRDTEVLLSRLQPGRPMAAEPGRQLLRDRMTERMAAARQDALDLLGSTRYLQLHEALVGACAEPVCTGAAERPAGAVLPPLVADAWHRLDKRAQHLLMEESQTAYGAPDHRWHKARIAAKRVRYAAEAVAPVIGKDAEKFAGAMESVTEVLGDHQDAAHAATVAEEFAADADADLAFALGVLCGAERAHVSFARAEFAAIWPDVSKEKLRKWFDS